MEHLGPPGGLYEPRYGHRSGHPAHAGQVMPVFDAAPVQRCGARAQRPEDATEHRNRLTLAARRERRSEART